MGLAAILVIDQNIILTHIRSLVAESLHTEFDFLRKNMF